MHENRRLQERSPQVRIRKLHVSKAGFESHWIPGADETEVFIYYVAQIVRT